MIEIKDYLKDTIDGVEENTTRKQIDDFLEM